MGVDSSATIKVTRRESDHIAKQEMEEKRHDTDELLNEVDDVETPSAQVNAYKT